jgi:Lrp/AsnC family transcriptional regulator
MQIDDTDRRILRHWLAEPGLDRAALAERAG